MNYTQIRKMDIANGEGIRVSLFVQGCEFYCKGCFNAKTWDFVGGLKWTKDIEREFLKVASTDYIDGITLLGGEPLHPLNVSTMLELVKKYKELCPDKNIWIYSGYKFEEMNEEQMEVLKYADVLVDGRFVLELKDDNLKFRGSSNQRIIDLKKTLSNNHNFIYTTDGICHW